MVANDPSTESITVRRVGPPQRTALPLAIGCIKLQIPGDLPLPAIAVREQPLLVEVQLLPGLRCEFQVGTFDDRVDGAGLLAQAAIDALHHVEVVSDGAAGAVVAARPGFDGD